MGLQIRKAYIRHKQAEGDFGCYIILQPYQIIINKTVIKLEPEKDLITSPSITNTPGTFSKSDRLLSQHNITTYLRGSTAFDPH